MCSQFFNPGWIKIFIYIGHDACIPSFIPPVLVKLMTEYLASGLREVEEILTHVVYGKEASDLIHTCVLSNLVNYLLLTP